MFSGGLSQLAIVVMATLCAGGVAWVFAAPYITGEARAGKRMKDVQRTVAVPVAKRREQMEAGKRRKQIQETLSDLESKQKQRTRPPLRVRLQQAHLSWSVRGYVVFSVVLGFVFAALTFILGGGAFVSLAMAVVGGLGFPYWMVNFLIKRRKKKFLEEFPNAVDIIVRGVKTGLPLGDCIRMVAGEAQTPVKEEFRQVVEAGAMGLPLSDCVERMYDRMPLAEVNFFTIVIAIQQKSGGNLSEALGNLSRVLRERKKMRGKIQAMSQEAKASAAIIGALPVAVMILVFLTSPDYISLLWTEPLGQMMLAGSAFWMLCGILVMRKMINFDF